MTHVITQPCCNDATCVPVCPVNCIHPTPDEPEFGSTEMLYIDPATCIDCGACIDACPVDAIVPDYELPAEQARFADINALYYADPAHRGYPEEMQAPGRPRCEVGDRAGPLRVAIVGSGPAACYAAEELLATRGCEVEVTMLERLPAPWGLARYGVAPDHPDTKSITTLFGKTTARQKCALRLNVEVGEHVSHAELLEYHHAVLYAVGASTDRRLGIPGEDLPGSHSATEFVAWYNGHPDYADRHFDLSAGRAVIIGNGNVALDVARMLGGAPEELARTDIAQHALDALAASRIEEIVVLGRRGPDQAAYTTPELLELERLTDTDVLVDQAEAVLDGKSRKDRSLAEVKSRYLAEIAAGGPSGRPKRIVLRYLTSPVEILGDERVRGIRLMRNEVVPGEDGTLEAHPTGETVELDCGLVLRSVGYRGTPLDGLPFDTGRGIVPTDGARVVGRDGQSLTGVYAAGWIKRGPSGGIGTNRKCAADTVRALLDDYARGVLDDPGAGGAELDVLLRSRQPRALSYADWKVLDRREQSEGRARGRPRLKLVDVDEILAAAEEDRSG